MKWLRYIAVFALLLAGALLLAQDDDEEDELTEQVEEAVLEIPGMRGVVSVELNEDDDDEPTLTVRYLTSETGPFGYRAETLDVYRAIGAVLAESDVTTIIIEPAVTEDSIIETITADLVSVVALTEGEMTRTAFLNDLQIEPGDHQMPDESNEENTA